MIDTYKQPLDPIHPKKARKLLDKGKAAVFRMYPFVIILKKAIPNPSITPCQIKIDPGSKFTGFALVKENQVIWAMELEHRGGLIQKKLESRRAVRRSRRNRKTRYRKPRFLNRKCLDGWLPPSLAHRVHTIDTWIMRLYTYVPIKEIVIERVKFDSQKMQNPEIWGKEYQQGTLQGYEVREYLLEKWGRKCAYCGKQDIPLQIEHIHPKSKGGSDCISNLCLACEKCNLKKSNRPIEEFLKGKPSLLRRIKAQAKRPFKDAAAVNATRNVIVQVAKGYGYFGITTKTGTGAQTKYNRVRLGLPKEHWIDAACVGEVETLELKTKQPLRVTCKGQGGRQKAALNKYGYPIRHNPLKPIKDWLTGDIARHLVMGIGKVTPRSNGSFGFTPLGTKGYKSCKPADIKLIHRKDGYIYSFC